MTWRDALRLAAADLSRRFGRAVLTVVAVALAAALLTALLTIAGTARDRVLSQLSKGGPLAGIKVLAAEPNLSELDSDNPTPGPPRPLGASALRQIEALPGVRSVVPIYATPELVLPPTPPVRPGTVPVVHGPTPSPSISRSPAGSPAPSVAFYPRPFVDQVVGVDLTRAPDLPVTILAGRLPQPRSLTEVAVSEGYLHRIGLPSTAAGAVVGTELELGAPRVFGALGAPDVRGLWSKAEIVGVVAQEVGAGQVVASAQLVAAGEAFSKAGGDPGGSFGISNSQYAALFVVASGLDRVGDVRDRITRIGYSTSAPENLIASVLRYLHVVEIVLTGIGVIALAIAALGITSAMLAAVRERRREIGVLKAIGARDRDVRRVFLLQAAATGFFGGLAGTAAGWLVALGLASVVNGYLTRQGLTGVHLGFVPLVVLAGIAGSTVLALAAGLFPAARAARLSAYQAVSAA